MFLNFSGFEKLYTFIDIYFKKSFQQSNPYIRAIPEIIAGAAEWYGVFNPYIGIDDHGYDGNHKNGIIDLTDKEIGERQSFL